MAKAKKISANSSLLMAIIFIVLGVMLLIGGVGAATNILMWIVFVMGIVLIVFGVLALLGGLIPVGVVELVVGILMVSFAWTLAWVAILVLGVLLLVAGIQGLGGKGNALTVVLDIILGIALICFSLGINWGNAWFGDVWATISNILFYVLGALMIVDGVLMLVVSKK